MQTPGISAGSFMPGLNNVSLFLKVFFAKGANLGLRRFFSQGFKMMYLAGCMTLLGTLKRPGRIRRTMDIPSL